MSRQAFLCPLVVNHNYSAQWEMLCNGKDKGLWKPRGGTYLFLGLREERFQEEET